MLVLVIITISNSLLNGTDFSTINSVVSIPKAKNYFVAEDTTVNITIDNPITTLVDSSGDYYYEFEGYTSEDVEIIEST